MASNIWAWTGGATALALILRAVLARRKQSAPTPPELEEFDAVPLFPVSQNDLEGVDERIIKVLNLAWQRGQRFFVIDAMRDQQEQDDANARGTSTVKTSLHQIGLAVDVAPANAEGKPELRDVARFRELAPHIKQAAADLKVPLRWLPDHQPEKADFFHWYILERDANV